MDHRTPLATFRTLALRVGTSARRGAGRTATTMARGVTSRIAERQAIRSTGAAARSRRPPEHPSRQPDRTAPDRTAAPAGPAGRRTPTPLDVARAAARNVHGLPRTDPGPQRGEAPPRSVPGAKLPARAGRGILGV